MKIQNVSSNNTPIPVSFMKGDGGTVSVSLNIGEFVFTDSTIESKSLIIQQKKGNLKTSTEDKPSNLEYYKVYGAELNISQEGIEKLLVKTTQSLQEEKDLALDKYKGQFKILPKAPPTPVKPDVPAPAPVVETPVDTATAPEQPAKNKGGRPKGSKDTVKRGEEKIKKPAGRPINTETLVGLTVEEVTTKCHSRGYQTRKTREDGKAYMITADLRPDRVNLVIENGIVIKADIG